MTNLTADKTLGFHMNEHLYSLAYPPCPKWVTSWESQKWHELGVVVWDSEIGRVTHLRGHQALSILNHSRKSDAWKENGLVVGEVAYCITLPPENASKKTMKDQAETKTTQEEDGWCLTNTIQLSPDQSIEFLSFLEQKEEILKRIAVQEDTERSRILGQVYAKILSWKVQQK
jgi:hypothetical protein